MFGSLAELRNYNRQDRSRLNASCHPLGDIAEIVAKVGNEIHVTTRPDPARLFSLLLLLLCTRYQGTAVRIP